MANDAQRFCLRWNNYQTSVTSVFESLRQDGELVDVTLCCEGRKVKAHRMLLSACSPYFRDILKDNPCQHPVFILKDMGYADLEALIEFMYNGEVNVIQTHLGSFLKAAETLQIKGLAGEQDDNATDKENEEPSSPHPVKHVNIKRSPSPPQVPIHRHPSPHTRPASPPVKRKKRHRSNGSSHSSHETPQAALDEDTVEILPIQPKVELPDVDLDGSSASHGEVPDHQQTDFEDCVATQFGDLIKGDYQNSFPSNDGTCPPSQPGPSSSIIPSLPTIAGDSSDHLHVQAGPSNIKPDAAQSQEWLIRRCPGLGDEVVIVEPELKHFLDDRTLTRDVGTPLETLISASGADNSRDSSPISMDVNLPLSTPEELARLERQLTDLHKRDKLINRLSRIGGGCAKRATQRLLRRVMTNGLAMGYNWVGRGTSGKTPFSTLGLRHVILEAIQRSCPDSTEAEIDETIKNWLKFAKSRVVRRRPISLGHTFLYHMPNVAVRRDQSPGTYPSLSPGMYASHAPKMYASHSPGMYTSRNPGIYTSHSSGTYSSRSPGTYTSDSPGMYTSHNPGSNASRSCGTDAPRNLGMDTARNLGTDASRNFGIDTARSIGADRPRNSGMETSRSPGADTAHNRGMDSSHSPGSDTHHSPGTDTLCNLGNDTPRSPGADTSYNSGKDKSHSPGINTSHSPETDTHRNLGMDAYRSLGTDTHHNIGMDTYRSLGTDTPRNLGMDTYRSHVTEDRSEN